MRKEDIIHGFIIAIIIIIICANFNGINSFLSVHTDKTVGFGHSEAVVPQAWNTTDELNMSDEAKNPLAITNGYIVIDMWDDWPEDHITDLSTQLFAEMEGGNYVVLGEDNTTLSGVEVSKQYFSNPSRNNNVTYNHISVNYVFEKEDTNYAIQVHYFTKHDYENLTFIKEVDDRVEDDMGNIHNMQFNAFFSAIWHIYEFITTAF